MENTQEYKSFLSIIGMRFLRGLVAGFVSSMAMLTTSLDVQVVFTNPKAYIYALLTGAISGGCLAVDKYLREKDNY